MFLENDKTENYFDSFSAEELSFYDNESNEDISDYDASVADELFGVLQGIIDEENKLTESFTSESNARKHYLAHCKRGLKSRESKYTNVYYDFKTFDDYINYESMISESAKSDKALFVEDFIDGKKIVAAFRKLFEGGKCLVFGLGCGFHNDFGNVRLCIRSWATEATKENYLYNTVDFLVQAPDKSTISLYPLDVNYLETKLNNAISKIPSPFKLKINH